MKAKRTVSIATALATLFLICGCGTLDKSPVGKGVKRYERYSDDLGKRRDVKFLGKDVIVEPEANEKIRISF
jgi:hypothetical protein